MDRVAESLRQRGSGLPPAQRLPISVRRLRSLIGRRAWVCGTAAAVLAIVAWRALGLAPAAVLLASAGFVWAAIPPLGRFVRRREVVAHPGGRAAHRRPTPLMGGLALYVPIALTLAWQGHQDARFLGLLAAVTLMAFGGAVDDARGMRARYKFLLQGLAGAVLVFSGFRIEAFSVEPLGSLELGWTSPAFVIVWVISVTNAFNLVDGIDGLAGMMAFVLAVGATAAGADALTAAALAGACLGFLRHNLPRASIFLGDTGSLVLGMTAAGLSLTLPVADNLPMALALVAYPAGDVAISVVRRTLRGKPPFTPDKSHVHHKIMACSHSPVRTLVYLLGFASLVVVLPLALPGGWALLAMAVAWVTLVLAVVRVCKVRIDQMVRHRPQFRHLHTVRKRLLADLHGVRAGSDVAALLRRISEDLDLVKVEAWGAEVGRPTKRDGPVHRVPLRLNKGTAHWEYVPWTDDRTLDTEVQSVVCEVLRTADRRLHQHGATRPKAASAEVGV